MDTIDRIKNKIYSWVVSKKFKSCGKSYFFSNVDIVNASRISIGNGCLFYSGVWLATQEESGRQGEIDISDSVVLSKDVIVSSAYRISIGEGVTIGPFTMIMDNNHGFKDLEISVMKQELFGEPITIGDYVWIGGHVTVLPGVSIGKGAIVGAGSVVTKPVEDYKIVVGNPARVIGDRREKFNG